VAPRSCGSLPFSLEAGVQGFFGNYKSKRKTRSARTARSHAQPSSSSFGPRTLPQQIFLFASSFWFFSEVIDFFLNDGSEPKPPAAVLVLSEGPVIDVDCKRVSTTVPVLTGGFFLETMRRSSPLRFFYRLGRTPCPELARSLAGQTILTAVVPPYVPPLFTEPEDRPPSLHFRRLSFSENRSPRALFVQILLAVSQEHPQVYSVNPPPYSSARSLFFFYARKKVNKRRCASSTPSSTFFIWSVVASFLPSAFFPFDNVVLLLFFSPCFPRFVSTSSLFFETHLLRALLCPILRFFCNYLPVAVPHRGLMDLLGLTFCRSAHPHHLIPITLFWVY